MNNNNSVVDKIVFKLYNPYSQFDTIKEIWTSMLQKCPHSYYLSWAWTDIWIKSLPPDCNLTLVAAFIDDSPVIAFFIGSKTTIWHKLFKFRQLSLNQTLIPYIDRIYIEYNAILIDPEITISLESLLGLIPIKSWDEFRMIRCSSNYQPNLIFNSESNPKYELNIEKQKSFYVNLDEVRRNNNDYLSLLSQNKRQQIRRSIKEYEKIGKIQIHVAENVEDALNIFDELIEIHQQRWTEHGHPGVFSDKYMSNFHKNLISRRFEHGEIQLIKVSAGCHILGCLYNIIYNGNVIFLISGFSYLPGNVYRPGLICHLYAIVYNAMIGLSSYDFLAGDASYKKSFSSDHNEMETIIIRKRGIKFAIKNIIVRLYRIYKRKMI